MNIKGQREQWWKDILRKKSPADNKGFQHTSASLTALQEDNPFSYNSIAVKTSKLV